MIRMLLKHSVRAGNSYSLQRLNLIPDNCTWESLWTKRASSVFHLFTSSSYHILFHLLCLWQNTVTPSVSIADFALLDRHSARSRVTYGLWRYPVDTFLLKMSRNRILLILVSYVQVKLMTMPSMLQKGFVPSGLIHGKCSVLMKFGKSK
jgi:hypothetical protein